VYLLYTFEEGSNTNDAGRKVSLLTRVTSDPNNLDVALPGSEVTILGSTAVIPCPVQPNVNCIPSDTGSHSIGTLRFGTDGKLWVSAGDGAEADFTDVLSLRSQDLDSFAGKILRINPDGTAPTDSPNPFFDGTDSVRSKVWAYGLRNPYRFALHPITGIPYIGDVGWNESEEVNKATAGANFGWPCFEGNLPQPSYQAMFQQCQDLSPASVTFPLYTYFHSANQDSAAIGGAVLQGNQYQSQ
jgi:glucose/arabinose dehydrogenase